MPNPIEGYAPEETPLRPSTFLQKGEFSLKKEAIEQPSINVRFAYRIAAVWRVQKGVGGAWPNPDLDRVAA